MPTIPLATQALHPLEDVLEPGINPTIGLPDDAQQAEDLAEADTPASELFEAPGKSKRKAIEIADSEEESGSDGSEDDETLLPPAVPAKNDFQPSSQIYRDGSQKQSKVEDNSTKKSRTVIVPSPHVPVPAGADVDEEDDEMLLEKYEKEIPPFSQAAAEMSEPLTPSDDGRDMT